MGNNRHSYLVNALSDNYEEPLDISLISNHQFIPSIGNNLNTPTNASHKNQINVFKTFQNNLKAQ